MKKINIKSILKFLVVFFISMILMEILEHSIQYFYHIDIPQLKYGWIAFMLIYGFKFHIFCCILPFLYTTYKCVGHKRKCKHKHCGK